MNLSGRWKGKYTYGSNYPATVVGTSEPFEFEIHDNNGVIRGTCVDNVVKAVVGNSSIIEGTFSDGLLIFVKKYKFHLGFDEDGKLALLDDVPPSDINYVGHFKKRFLSGKIYFTGEWQINFEWTDAAGNTFVSLGEGTWEMSLL